MTGPIIRILPEKARSENPIESVRDLKLEKFQILHNREILLHSSLQLYHKKQFEGGNIYLLIWQYTRG